MPGVDAELGGRVRAGAEGTTRVDHDSAFSGLRALPRRSDPEPTGADGPVEGAPGVLPAGFDGGHLRLRVGEGSLDRGDRALVDIE